MTGFFILNVTLSTGILVVIVDMLLTALKADHRSEVAPASRAAARTQSSRVPLVLAGMAAEQMA